MKPTVVDFETFGIAQRPEYPPMPVSVAIKRYGRAPQYFAWGHASENNTQDLAAVREILRDVWRDPVGLLFQNAQFDLTVAEKWFGLTPPPWHLVHDTLLLLYLHNPHAKTLSLKPNAAALLGYPTEDQDAIGQWLLEHQPVPGVTVSDSKKSDHYFMGYIPWAPGKLVGTYAKGDVARTWGLFEMLAPQIQERGMWEAYDRERKLQPILRAIEAQGIRVAGDRLAEDYARLRQWNERLEDWVRTQTKTPDLQLTSGQDLAEALIRSGHADRNLFGHTPKPKKDGTPRLKTDKETLDAAVTDPTMLATLRYLSRLRTSTQTFMRRWLAMRDKVARDGSGRKDLIFTEWHQTRGEDEGGTRTGRLSSTPNFQNIPKVPDVFWRHHAATHKHGKTLPRAPWKDLPPLPLLRDYIIPFQKNHVLIDRDYSQQELRLLAHFAGGSLLQAYKDDPWLDMHDFAQDLINNMLGTSFARGHIKNTAFGLIYGMGVGKLAIQSETTVDLAKQVKNAYLAAFPELREMYNDMKALARDHEPLVTWDGREYYCEPPREDEHGRMKHFDYKMVNALIQGSAAGVTKQAWINWWEMKHEDDVILLTVHDQMLGSTPFRRLRLAMTTLREAMESITMEVPMLSEGKWSPRSWADLRQYDKKGQMVYAPEA